MEFMNIFELISSFNSYYCILVLMIIIIITNLLVKTNSLSSSKAKKAPEAPGAWPIIGHLRLFMSKTESPYVTLGAMADKYGPAFNVRFGCHEILVLSSWEMIKECFTTNDALFSNRPDPLNIRQMFNCDESLGFAPYGPFWKEMRKIAAQQLLSNQQLRLWKDLKYQEIYTSFNDLNELCNKNGGTAQVRMDYWFAFMTYNIFAAVVAGYQSKEPKSAVVGEQYKKAMEDLLHLTTVFAFSDVVPCLKWVDRLRGLVRKMNCCREELNSIAEGFIEEGRRKRRLREGDGDQNFIDVLLTFKEKSQLPGQDHDAVIQSMVLDMLSGGSDTTYITLTWILALLLNNPHDVERAREELDAHVGKNRQVEESDIPNLLYIQAIIKESMRLYPTATLLPRMTMEACEVGGFHVPAGGYLYLNIWKIQRDPKVWENPSEYRPERFLTDGKEDMDVKGQNYELIPFGVGRRMCPGVTSALQVLHLVVARLIQGFDMKAATPDGKADLTEGVGMVTFNKNPLEVIMTRRF
ncbi:hypothetical protein MKW98_032716 [Papaver atlanticum]|uniref:Cytochrome P450 n=1 Tax=Papaver atlanticum TaxID=357466 RepID=A0AAD4SU89_9MAGN|nr:hypothetical protein MKW98_020509 [Papaver atlanticum]KAI3926676.1 hypothetical protein MKW98_032716 [Papaver atlanticum]